jgi:hypothetical protein
MLPLIVLMVWMGTFTQSFLPPISASNTVILGPVDARRDVHVQHVAPGRPAIAQAKHADSIVRQRISVPPDAGQKPGGSPEGLTPQGPTKEPADAR